MRVAVVHGYYLADSGSGVYTRELAHALVRAGHDVTLVCQEREPELFDFIDEAYVLDASNTLLELALEAPVRYPGRCRLVRPDVHSELLVYVKGAFPGFSANGVTALKDATEEQIARYVDANTRALQTAFERWQPDVVLAQHVIMQPVVVARALAGRAPYTVTAHGSELNFAILASETLVPYALEALSGAAAMVALSEDSREAVAVWARLHGLDVAEKTHVRSAGIDDRLFSPAGSRGMALEALLSAVQLPAGFDVRPDDAVVAFAGPLRPTKGIQYAVAACTLAASRFERRVRFLVAGDGPAGESLARLALLLEAGNVSEAAELVATDALLAASEEWGPVVVDAPPAPQPPVTALLGRLTHEQLATVFAFADVAVAPSTFPEAQGLVNVEAFSAGAIPLPANHSGMSALVRYLVDSLDDEALRRLVPGCELTIELAELIEHALRRYPTTDPAFRARMHALATARFPTWDKLATQYLELAF